jgi:ATP-binding cassette, subfamily B, bacterial MsbA
MRQFFRILAVGKPYRRYVLFNAFFNLLTTAFHLGSMLLLIPFLQLLLQQTELVHERPPLQLDRAALQGNLQYALTRLIETQGALRALALICSLVVVCFLLKNCCRYLAVGAICIFRNRIVHDLRGRIYQKMLGLPLGYHAGERKGHLLSVITNDMQVLEFSVMYSIEMMFREPLAIGLFLSTMIALSPKLTIISLVLLPLSGLLIARISRTLKKRGTRVQQSSADLLARVEETLGGIRVVKAFSGEQDMQRRFDRENERLMKASISLLRRQDMASPLSETMGSVVMAVMAYIGGSLALGTPPEMAGSTFIAYIAIFAQLLTPIKGLSQGWSGIVRGSASAQRVFDLLAVENTVKEAPNPLPLSSFTSQIEFHQVSFAYDDRQVLHQVQLVVPKGHRVALVGPSGGGKSTMAGLLPRFFDVTSGAVRIDGHDVRHVRVDDLRGLIGMVAQESVLFNDTIANNIAFGKPGTTLAEVQRAAEIANAHGFIEQLPEGYQTSIGDGGNRLSGGQKQRIAIARAVLRNPEILVLDEATSALDSESERLVQDALYKLMKDRTALVIAHRLSTIQHCDEICVLQEGRIVERGTHAQLMGLGGVYRKLVDIQALG